MAGDDRQFGIIAGSGFKSFAGDSPGTHMVTEFGQPSGPLRTVDIGGHAVRFLPRHGDDLLIPPHAINYRANLKALQLAGVDTIVSMNTVGVIKAGLHPGQLAIPDQLIDYTWGRDSSIYEGFRSIDHVDFTEPFCGSLRSNLLEAAGTAGVGVHDGGVYAVTQGPRLETAAEVVRLERDGADYVGMTAMPEAGLARELGMAYACLSLIVNYAAGRGEQPIHDDLEAGTATARADAIKVLRALLGSEEE
jgi:purine nucleoside phosphorylase